MLVRIVRMYCALLGCVTVSPNDGMIRRGAIGGRESSYFIHEGLAAQLAVTVLFWDVFVFSMGEGSDVDIACFTFPCR